MTTNVSPQKVDIGGGNVWERGCGCIFKKFNLFY
jgi:hypothetical protein